MNRDRILAGMEHTITLLYQNKEKEGMDMVMQLLAEFQQMAEAITGAQADEVRTFALIVIKELLEGYQNGDVLAMADCLLEKGTVLTQAYFEVMGY